jgi:hypothetical protein
MSFKHHFNSLVEAKVPTAPKVPDMSYYETPGPRAKFQDGDIVLVRIPRRQKEGESYFRLYHPKYCVPYMNAVGIVKSYFNTGYQTNYAIEAEDGKMVPIAASFLVGPFNSVEGAKKYQGNNDKIASSDLKGFVDRDIEIDSKLENEFRQSFCNDEVGFKWIDDPVLIQMNNNVDVYVLAFKKNVVPINDDWGLQGLGFVSEMSWNRLNKDAKKRPEYDNGFVFFKTVDRLSGALKATSALSDLNGRTGKYFLQQPDYKSWFMLKDQFVNGKSTEGVFHVKKKPIGSGLSKIKDNIIKKFKQHEEGFDDGFELFKSVYNIDESSSVITAPDDIEILESVLGPHMKEIENYEFKCKELSVWCADSATKIGYLPKKVSGMMDIHHVGSPLANLKGLERCDLSNVKSLSLPAFRTLEGFPEQMNKPQRLIKFIHSNDNAVESLVGIPNIVYANLFFSNLKSFKGADDCVALGKVSVQHSPKSLDGFFKEAEDFDSWTITDEEIKKFTKFRKITNRLPELKGMFD